VIALSTMFLAARGALIAEENLQAFLHAQLATIDFVEANDGKWPKSWDDLRSMRPETNFSWVADHITYDFSADPRAITANTPENFSAIVPAEPCFPISHRVEVLLDVLKKYHQVEPQIERR